MTTTVLTITEVLNLTHNADTDQFDGEAGWQVAEATIDLEGGDTSYDFLKSIVPGVIAVQDIGHGVDMWYDDEFLYTGAKFNPIASLLAGGHFCGPVVLAGSDDEGETVGLTPEQINKIVRFFDHIEERVGAHLN